MLSNAVLGPSCDQTCVLPSLSLIYLEKPRSQRSHRERGWWDGWKMRVAACPASALGVPMRLKCQTRLWVAGVASKFGLLVRWAMAVPWDRNAGEQSEFIDLCG